MLDAIPDVLICVEQKQLAIVEILRFALVVAIDPGYGGHNDRIELIADGQITRIKLRFRSIRIARLRAVVDLPVKSTGIPIGKRR